VLRGMIDNTFFKRRKQATSIFATGFTLLVAVFWITPIVASFIGRYLQFVDDLAFYGNTTPSGFFAQWLRNLSIQEWMSSLEARWYFNSIFSAVTITVLTIVLAAPCAYAISRLQFPGKTILYWSILAGLMLPKDVLIVPLFLLMHQLSSIDSYQGVILPQIIAPLAIVAYKYYFDQVSTELREAAVIDGAGELRILTSIYMPVNRPVTMALVLFAFIGAWNNFFWPFIVLYSETMWTLPVAMGSLNNSFMTLATTFILTLVIGLVTQTLFFTTGVVRVGVVKRGFNINIKKWSLVFASIAVVITTVVLIINGVNQARLAEPLETPLMTRWAKEVTPDNVLPEYPRPQLVREAWQNLNGLWEYAIRLRNSGQPKNFDGQILVPFPIESALSGVSLRVEEGRRLWYRRTFEIPSAWEGKHVLLHFGAVDYEATLWVNGQEVGTHVGGYDAFSFDITNALTDSGTQEVVVSVWDPSDAGTQPRGKQVREPEGIWYRSTTGIWQTVWLEPVSEARIESLKMEPDIDAGILTLVARVEGRIGVGEQTVKAVVLENGEAIAEAIGAAGQKLELRIPDAKLWTPDGPFLYDLQVTLYENDKEVDEVSSYFGMRKISLGRDEQGVTRLLLNNEILFQYGLLDQGFWPDGLYTAPTDEALRYDIEVTKQLGFNMIRKHVKVEPERWYYWADKLGVLVWQDMPSGDAFVDNGSGEITRSPESAEQFEAELKRMIDTHYNHPSIVMWVIFNEGWGQYDTVRLTQWLKEYDPTRLVNSASGWNDMQTGDVHDIHSYPGPLAPQQSPDRASVLGEFGGLGLPIKGLTWQDEGSWGYRQFTTQEELLEAYTNSVENLRRLIVEEGLAAAVYTQTTDVEIEVNGMMTYDRALAKLEPVTVKWINRILFRDLPVTETFVPTAETTATTWRYTLTEPSEDWFTPDFDDSSWQEGVAGFGSSEKIAAGTKWSTSDIWLRHTFTLGDVSLLNPFLRVFHDDDMEVYLNGELISKLPYYTLEYVEVDLGDEARAVFRKGENTLSVHCKNLVSEQFCDVGLFDRSERVSSQ
jgi:ABC-type glycerol-3-phosphate transport system permease component